MKPIKIIALFSIMFFMSAEICAQKLGAAEIYYELLSYKKYKVTAQVYRKCNDSSLNKLDG